jgi:hypothetical protein
VKSGEVTKFMDIPHEDHYVVLVRKSTNIGDGYGGDYHLEHLDYIPFDDPVDLKMWIRENMATSTFRVLKVSSVHWDVRVDIPE